MRRLKKISAFTLNEMVVALVLTAIVVGLAFSILSLTQKQMLGIQQNYIKNDVLRQFEQALWVDFNKYHTAIYNDYTNELVLKNEIDSVNYSFKNGFVLKNLDTLKMALAERIFYLDGKQVSEGIIDAIEIITSKESQNPTVFVYKKKDAAYYMN